MFGWAADNASQFQCAWFNDTVGFPSIYKANLVVLVWVFVCGSSPFACLLRCCFLLRNANLAGGFACHRCWCCVFLVFVSRYLPRYYGTKEFHNVFNWFNRSSQCSDRASERNRPTEEKKYKINENGQNIPIWLSIQHVTSDVFSVYKFGTCSLCFDQVIFIPCASNLLRKTTKKGVIAVFSSFLWKTHLKK